MGVRLSNDLRERVVGAYERGDGGYVTDTVNHPS